VLQKLFQLAESHRDTERKLSFLKYQKRKQNKIGAYTTSGGKTQLWHLFPILF